MRRGMQGLALTVRKSLKRDPHAGDFISSGGVEAILPRFFGMMASVCHWYGKHLNRGKFIWPSPSDGTVSISAAQMAHILEGID